MRDRPLFRTAGLSGLRVIVNFRVPCTEAPYTEAAVPHFDILCPGEKFPAAPEESSWCALSLYCATTYPRGLWG